MKIRTVQRVPYIVSQCEGKRVLHLGCTNWPYTDDAIKSGMLLHADLAGACSELYGIDSDQEGLDRLRELGFEDLFPGDLESLENSPLSETFDVVVAGEMIEHLNNPGLFLSGVKRFLRDDSILIITTINAYCAMRFLIYALKGRTGENEPVHPDHVAYYSASTLGLLLKRHGFNEVEMLFYDLGIEHRPFNRKVLNLFNDLAVTLFPQLSDGLIVKCRLSEM